MSRIGPLFIAAVLLLTAAPAADEGWVIERLMIRYDIHDDGTISASEAIDVDFGSLSRRGIYRDIRNLFDYDDTQIRRYDVELGSVTNAAGQALQVRTSDESDSVRFRIGDPDRTVSGKQTYRIRYRLGGALNGFSDHVEFYWNATGTWPVTVRSTEISVRAPAGAIDASECFQGPSGSKERCDHRITNEEALFRSTRPLAEGEQLTVVARLRKGAVAEPQPRLLPKRQRRSAASPDFGSIFSTTPAMLGLTAASLVLVIGGVSTLWWRIGRDRRYLSMYHLSQDSRDERLPMFGAQPIAVEFEPPERLRPAQIGLLIDERADTLDVTATVIDLAVRGYLTITEIPKQGWFGSKDWKLTRLKEADAELLEYEKLVLHGLFEGKGERNVSDLKNEFYTHLNKAKKALYADGVTRSWFPADPSTIRTATVLLSLLVVVAGFALTVALGIRWSAGLVGLPVIAGGMLLLFLSRAMPRRTAAGRELMHRSLGFERYVKTAETQQHAFAERANIFTAYLPYAIVFKCVDGWARAFRDIDMQAATSGFYAGTGPFNSIGFTSSLSSFSSSVSSNLSSTPGGSGSSGFGGGGSSGGGGGGGGGGSW